MRKILFFGDFGLERQTWGVKSDLAQHSKMRTRIVVGCFNPLFYCQFYLVETNSVGGDAESTKSETWEVRRNSKYVLFFVYQILFVVYFFVEILN